MELHLEVIGIILILLALIHIIFPKYFNWKEDLGSLSLINREVMYVHTFFIAVTVFLMGVLCFTSAPDLIKTSLGNKIMLGFGIFWISRLFIQIFGYSSSLWKGKPFETIVHIVFCLLWIYLSSVFFWIYCNN